MFKNILLQRNHTLTVVNEYGDPCDVRATCDEINRRTTSHTFSQQTADGTIAYEVWSCVKTNEELQRTLSRECTLSDQVEKLTKQLADLTAERDNGVRLMAGALQIIYGVGGALKELFDDDLGSPELLTTDRTAVKLDAVQYSVLVMPFAEQLMLCPVSDRLSNRTFDVTNGQLSEATQTNMLGFITRIKRMAAGGGDPIREAINLVATGVTAV